MIVFLALIVFLICGLYTVVTSQQPPLTQKWQLVTDNAPFTPRDSAELVLYEDKMWLSNGYRSGNIHIPDLWKSDGNKWTKILSNTPYDPYSHIVVYNNKLWAIKSTVWTSTNGTEWKYITNTPFDEGDVVIYKNRIWFFDYYANIWNTKDGITWNKIKSDAPYLHRSSFAVTTFNDYMWMVGGSICVENTPPEKVYPKQTSLNDTWRSKNGIYWEKVTEKAPWKARKWHKAIEYKNKLWIIAGMDNHLGINFNDTWYTIDGSIWTEYVGNNSYSPRHAPAVCVFNNSIYLVAGNDFPCLNDVWRFT